MDPLVVQETVGCGVRMTSDSTGPRQQMLNANHFPRERNLPYALPAVGYLLFFIRLSAWAKCFIRIELVDIGATNRRYESL